MSVSAQLESPKTDLAGPVEPSSSRWPDGKAAMKESMEIPDTERAKTQHNQSLQEYPQTPSRPGNSKYSIPLQKPRISLNSTNRSYNYGYKGSNPMNNSFTETRTGHENSYRGEQRAKVESRNQTGRSGQDLFLKLHNPISYKPISLGVYKGCETTRENKNSEFLNARQFNGPPRQY